MSGPQSRGPRPPMNQNQGPTPPHHPPAKRPRFDGPGPGPGGGPTHLGGPGRASLPVRPGTGSIPARPPSGPRAPLPPPPITRPPIHLGSGGPPPVFAPGGPRNNAGPMRGGGERGRGRGGMVMNAPRGPSHMRRERQDHQRQRSTRSEVSPGKKDSRKDKKKEKEKEAKTTLTDFRIVGIEMKELGWKWGLVGDEAMNQAEEEEVKAEKVESEVKAEKVNGEGAEPGAEPTADEPAEEKIKEETVDLKTDTQEETAEPAASTKTESTTEPADDSVKEESSAPQEDKEGNKTGGKRKAQSPETGKLHIPTSWSSTDNIDEGSSKKRSTYLLTHGKTNDTPSHESSQNRFRIYFESPPEADRIPQALRRNPYKRWRREDSAAPAPAPAEKAVADESEKAKEEDLPVIDEVAGTEGLSTQENIEKVDEAGPLSVDAADDTAETTAPETSEIDLEAPVEAESTPAVDNVEDVATVAQDAQPESVSAETTDTAAEVATVPDVVVETDVEVPATAAEQAPVDTEPPKEDELPPPPPSGDDSAAAADPPTADADATALEIAPAPSTATAEETAAAIVQSAENAASAYKSRTRRRSSVSSTDSRETLNAFQPEVTPSLNRLSILYEGSQRRMCFDADVVEMIKVYRAEGRIEVCFAPAVKAEPKEGEDDENNGSASTSTLLPKGYLVSLLYLNRIRR
jgi:20S proteasome subunit alpha 6